jgi:hypothetical protein
MSALRISLPAGTALFREGEVPTTAFLIEEGEIEVSMLRGGERVTLSRLGPGDLLGALTGDALNFGRPSPTTSGNQDTLKGWGVRENDWQWGLTVQHEVLPRVSLEVRYARRWWSGFTVTDNVNRDPSQYDSWTILAPVDPRLPQGGGYPPPQGGGYPPQGGGGGWPQQ